MSNEPQMFRINPENRESEKISEVEFSRLGLQERRDIQEWIAANPGILGEGLLIVGKEFSGFDLTNERLDLLAVDWDGKLVIIELKRDDTGADAHWQAIKYASYLRHATPSDIVRMLADYGEIAESDAYNRLLQHIDADDLNTLNHDQRIILASHRFAPEVTSAVLWLNEKAPDDSLITCIQLIPYHDQQQDTLYVQASTIIPLPGIDDYVVKVADSLQRKDGQTGGGYSGRNRSQTFKENQNHETTPFLRQVGDLVTSQLADEIRPDRRSRWSRSHSRGFRYYHFWYSQSPWSNWGLSYRVNLYPQQEPGSWRADVELKRCNAELKRSLAGISLPVAHSYDDEGIVAPVGIGLLDDEFAGRIVPVVRSLIEQATPVVDDLANAINDPGK